MFFDLLRRRSEPFSKSANSPISAVGVKVYHPTHEIFAFGRWNYQKLNYLSQVENFKVQDHALQSLCDVVYDPQQARQCFRAGFRETMMKLTEFTDEQICTKLAEILSILSITPAGRAVYLDYTLLEPAKILLESKFKPVRKFVITSLKNMALIPDGAAYIAYENILVKLLTSIQSEDNDIQEDILDVLNPCLKVNNFETEKVLNSKGIWIMLMLLKSEPLSLKVKAAEVITSLSVPFIGKRRATLVGAIPVLYRTLGLTSDSKLRAKMCAAIAMITVLKEAKQKALSVNGIIALFPMLKDKSAETRMNALKAITMLVDIPNGRKQALEYVTKIHHMISDPDPEVRKIAEITYDTIIWKAW